MTTTEALPPPRAARLPVPWRDAPGLAHPVTAAAPEPDAEAPSFRSSAAAALDEIGPVLGVIPVAGPPAVLLLGPWLLIGLMLAAPFAVLVTLTLVLVAAAAAVALAGLVVASPYLLVRAVRRHASGGVRLPALPGRAARPSAHLRPLRVRRGGAS
jgi:hypothetical protein